MSQMKKTVTSLSEILQDEVKKKALLKLRGYHAQCLIDYMDYFLSDPEFRNAMEPGLLKLAVAALCELCEVSMLHPARHVLTSIRDVSLDEEGAFCDIYQGRYDRHRLCLKGLRVHQKQNQEELLRVLAREATLWSQLDHANIVPFYGIFYLERKEHMSLVSPWMENRDIMVYLWKVPEAPRKPFIHDIINGLEYLHAANIVHGGLTVHKVLIDDRQNACLTDFGLSNIVMDEEITFAVRWSAPEHLKRNAPITHESDVWSFGCVCYQVLTGKQPFAGVSDIKVTSKLMKGGIPARLDDTTLDENINLNKKIRELVKKCWSIKPEERPACSEILREIENMPIVRRLHGRDRVNTRSPTSRPGFWFRNPGSTFSTNLNRGQKTLEDIHHGNEVVGVSDAVYLGGSNEKLTYLSANTAGNGG